MRRRPAIPASYVSALIVALGLASCASTEADAATSVAERLLAAADRGSGGDACRLLAPSAREVLEYSTGKPCDEAVLEKSLGTGEAVEVEVFDSMAQVRFEDDTLFLSRFDGAWLVVAAACIPRAPYPYDCDIEVS